MIIQNLFYKIIRTFNSKANFFYKRHKIIQPTTYPTELFIEPTNICNAKCPLCPTGSGKLKRKKGFMSFKTFKKIINESKPYIKTVCLWNMGEPFLNKDIFKMIKYAKKQKIFTVSSTNGYVFYNKKNIIKLMKSGLDKLYVGMDGTDQETFSKYRKNVDFNKIVEGLKFIKNYKIKSGTNKPNIIYQFIAMKHNEKQINEAKKIAKSLNTQFLLKYVSLEMVSNKKKSKFLPSSKKLRIYKKTSNDQFLIDKHNQNESCVLWNALLINWDGTVNPCIFDYYSKIILGNIKNQSIKQIWKNQTISDLKDKILTDRTKIDICKNCPIQNNYSEEFKN